MNHPAVDRFYNNLETILLSTGVSGDRIFNVDECGVTPVHKPGRILCMKGRKQVGKITSGERGQTVTVLLSMSATGFFPPPMLIFKRKRRDPSLARGAPAGSLIEISDSGWITAELFNTWIAEFAKLTGATKERPVVVILDNHSSHISLSGWDLCRENGIHMVSLPPHTSHRLQPLDVTYMKPFKMAFNGACDSWMLAHPGERILQSDVSRLVNTAFTRASVMSTAINGFKSTGIWPFDRSVVPDAEFVAAEVLGYGTEAVQEITPPSPCSPSPGTVLAIPCAIPQSRKRRTQESVIITATPTKKRILAKKKTNGPMKSQCGRDRPKSPELEHLLSRVSKGSTAGSSGNAIQTMLEFEDDDNDDETAVELDGSMNIEVDPTPTSRDRLNVGDFIIAQLSNKKFVAKVTFVGEDGVTVKFLKRTVKDGGFIVNESDISFVDYEEVVKVLPKPFCSGGTRRASFLLKFSCDLSAFGV